MVLAAHHAPLKKKMVLMGVFLLKIVLCAFRRIWWYDSTKRRLL